MCENLGINVFPIPVNYDNLRQEKLKALSDNYEANKILKNT